MSGHAEVAKAHFELPDGRVLACVNDTDAEVVWKEIEDGTTYAGAAKCVRPGATVIDIGAHVGLMSLYFADQADDVRVIACEPAPWSFSCLRSNFERYLPGAVSLPVAVGAHAGEAELTYYPNQPTMTTLSVDDEDDRRNMDAILKNVGVSDEERAQWWESSRRDPQRLTVPVVTLSDLLAAHQVRSVALLKIDVERSELEVLQGISEPDYRKIDAIVLEVHDIDHRLTRVTELLRERNYSVDVFRSAVFTGSSVHTVLAQRRHD